MAYWVRLSSSAHSPYLPGDMWPKCSFHPISVTSSWKKRSKHRIRDKAISPDANIPIEICYIKQRTLPHFETLWSTLETEDTKKIASSGIHSLIYRPFNDINGKTGTQGPLSCLKSMFPNALNSMSYQATALPQVRCCNAMHKVQYRHKKSKIR